MILLWRLFTNGSRIRKDHTRSAHAMVILADNSGVIAEDIELLKHLGKPTFPYEYSNKTGEGRAGETDHERINARDYISPVLV